MDGLQRMKRITFSRRNRSGNLLHIEIPGAIVNIRVNLRDITGHEVTSVEIIPGDYPDSRWELSGTRNNRIIKIKGE